MKLSLLIILLPFSLCWGQPSFDISSSELIDDFVEVTSSTTTNVYLHPNSFTWNKLPFDKYTVVPFSTAKWYRFTLTSSLEQEKVLAFSYKMTPSLDVYIFSSVTQNWSVVHMGTVVADNHRARGIPLKFIKGEVKEIYYRVYGYGTLTSSNPEILSSEVVAAKNKVNANLGLIMRTVFVVFILIGSVLFYSLKDKMYSNFVIALLGAFLFIEVESGSLLGLFSLNGLDISYFFKIVAAHALVVSFFYFLRDLLFLEDRKQKGNVGKYFNVVFIAIEIIYLLFSQYPMVVSLTYTIAILLILIFIIVASYKIINKERILNFDLSTFFYFLIVSFFLLFVVTPYFGVLSQNYFSAFYLYSDGIISSVVMVCMVLLKVYTVNTENKRLTKLEEKFQKEYLKAILDSQEAERNAIGKEIQKKITNDLNLLDTKLKQTTLAHSEVLQETLDELKLMTYSLKKMNFKEENWIIQVNQLTSRFSTTVMKFDFTTNTDSLPLKYDDLENLYSIIQELFVNAVKHSFAKQVHLEIKLSEENVLLTYRDNGKGLSEKNNKSGIGLLNIQQRVTALTGEMTINSSSGLYVEINIPVTNNLL
ncbi:sensor histidine kinase [Flammeovirga kamogawensis]|uniref:histidine kinase n=1 Tax=Flammeovirga kamogawensis TaxID=373891 RepID=A0ABX8GQ30_9BACT|nr:ATP-binding protein [Flammeovirga kamogawensis]MBB6463058.1 signal transduction histidine kinase [Flammeovirga kamogawensis]QWG05695.1 hypothetical protein KM029_09895 [Flammeovirga kamogawensis]TRX67523.1 hypothetical protein EO216_04925 [Flammeovirga kamogawensis]